MGINFEVWKSMILEYQSSASKSSGHSFRYIKKHDQDYDSFGYLWHVVMSHNVRHPLGMCRNSCVKCVETPYQYNPCTHLYTGWPSYDISKYNSKLLPLWHLSLFDETPELRWYKNKLFLASNPSFNAGGMPSVSVLLLVIWYISGRCLARQPDHHDLDFSSNQIGDEGIWWVDVAGASLGSYASGWIPAEKGSINTSHGKSGTGFDPRSYCWTLNLFRINRLLDICWSTWFQHCCWTWKGS